MVGFWRADHGGHKVSKWEDEIEGWLKPFGLLRVKGSAMDVYAVCLRWLIGRAIASVQPMAARLAPSDYDQIAPFHR